MVKRYTQCNSGQSYSSDILLMFPNISHSTSFNLLLHTAHLSRVALYIIVLVQILLCLNVLCPVPAQVFVPLAKDNMLMGS